MGDFKENWAWIVIGLLAGVMFADQIRGAMSRVTGGQPSGDGRSNALPGNRGSYP